MGNALVVGLVERMGRRLSGGMLHGLTAIVQPEPLLLPVQAIAA
jgi:hypothetical protein